MEAKQLCDDGEKYTYRIFGESDIYILRRDGPDI